MGGNERLARDAIKFRAGCAGDEHPRNLMKRARASSVASGDRAFGHARRREARVARDFHQTKGGSLEKKCRGSRRSPSTEDDGLARREASFLAFARPSARSVVRTAMSADDASIVTRPHTWRRVTSLRGAGSILLGGVFFGRGRFGGSRLVKNTASDPVWANSMARVPNHRALRLAKLESRSADYLRRSQLRARRQVAASHTRRRTSSAGENTHASRPSRRIREDSGRTLGRDNRERRGFGTGEKTAWASSETTPVTPWWIARPRSRP